MSECNCKTAQMEMCDVVEDEPTPVNRVLAQLCDALADLGESQGALYVRLKQVLAEPTREENNAKQPLEAGCSPLVRTLHTLLETTRQQKETLSEVHSRLQL